MDELFNVRTIISLTEKWEYMYIIIMFMIPIFFNAVLSEMRERIHKKFSNVFDSWKLTEFEKMFSGPDRKDKWQKLLSTQRT